MTAHIDRCRTSIEEFLIKYPCVDDVVSKASEKTKVGKVNLVMGLIGFTAVWLAIGYGSPFLCDFIGFVFPAYLSFKAVESADTRDDTQWLTYWIVYSYFGILEFFSDYLLFWIPFYSLIKCCFLLWMVNYNGAATIYSRFVRKMMRQSAEVIDDTLQVADEIQTNIQTYVTDKIHGIQTAVSADDIQLLTSDDNGFSTDNGELLDLPIETGLPVSANSLGPEFEFEFTSLDPEQVSLDPRNAADSGDVSLEPSLHSPPRDYMEYPRDNDCYCP